MNLPSFESCDEFGVALEIFGVHDPDFFPLLGRLVALAAVTEYDVRTLACKLVASEACHASKGRTTDVLKAMRSALGSIRGQEARRDVDAYLREIAEFQPRRDAYVHGLWPAVSLEAPAQVVGWRLKPDMPDLPLGKDLSQLREDVKKGSELVVRWNRQIIHLVADLPWLQMLEESK